MRRKKIQNKTGSNRIKTQTMTKGPVTQAKGQNDSKAFTKRLCPLQSS